MLGWLRKLGEADPTRLTLTPSVDHGVIKGWTPSCMGIWKINVDASCILGFEGIGTAAVICDHVDIVHGAMLKGYSGSLDVKTAKLLAVWDRLRLACKHQFRSIIVESDAKKVEHSILN